MKTRPSFLPTIEPLETRIAPATFIFVAADVDGDIVTVKITTAAPLPQATQNALSAMLETAPGSGLFNGQKLDLTDPVFNGASVEIKADPDPLKPKAAQGDGFVNFGYIDATGNDLKKVRVDGDLGQIDAGDADTKTPAIREGIKAESMGLLGTRTQGVGGNLVSNFIGKVKSIEICGSLVHASIVIIGGADGKLDSAKIGHSIFGDSPGSGRIVTTGDAGKISVGGTLFGGAGNDSGSISIGGTVGEVTVGGAVSGAAGADSGSISARAVKTGITVNGDVIGGFGADSGTIKTNGATPKVKISGSVRGGDGVNSGTISLGGPTKRATVGGDLLGGDGPGSGSLFASSRLDFVSIGHDVIGGAGNNSGVVFAAGEIRNSNIGGDLIGGDGNFSGGLVCSNTIRSSVIWGDIIGGSVSGTDSIDRSGFVDANRILNLTVKGNIIAGNNTGSGTIAHSGFVGVNNDFGKVVIKGSTIGNDSNSVVMSAAFSANKEIVFKSILIGGSAHRTDILAGYNTLGRPVNADAQIGAVTVKGDWLASNLVAGIFAGTDGVFGTPDDKAINAVDNPGSFNNPARFSSIGTVKIGCQAQGDVSGATGHFGIAATKIAKIVTDGRTYKFTAGPANDVFRIGSTGGPGGDFFAHEVSA
jgi:hypothetical protein